jgi:hypothetical protein
MEVSGQLHAPAALPPGKEPSGTHLIGDWVDPRAGVNALATRKILCLCRKSNPSRPAQRLLTILTELSIIIIIIIIIILVILLLHQGLLYADGPFYICEGQSYVPVTGRRKVACQCQSDL